MLTARRLARLSLSMLIPLLAGSCTDVIAVQQFAQASREVGIQFRPLAVDGLRSCHRAATYLLSGQAVSNCLFFESAEPTLLAVNNGLFSYISSLGRLADLDAGKTAGSLQNVGAELQQADPKISADSLNKANASIGLASALVDVMASRYQQKKMVAIIEHSNSAVQQVAGFLDVYAAFRYAQQIRDEQSRELAFCTQWTDPAVPGVATEPIAVDLLKRRCTADFDSQAEKIAAIQKYQQALRDVASAHQKLYEARNRWNTRQLVTDLAPAISQISEAAQAMKKAF